MIIRQVSSVASFLVLGGGGGGGGKHPKCTDRRKKNLVHVTYMRERAPQKHIGLYFHIWCGTINDSIGQKTNIEKIYAYASELGKISHFYILKLLFPSTFCWYF